MEDKIGSFQLTGVELIVERWGTLFRLLGDTSFALEGKSCRAAAPQQGSRWL